MKDIKEIKINNKTLGDGCVTFIVVDMAWSHDGSIDNAKRIIDGAAEAKADAIKFHITSLEDYMIPHYGSSKGRVSAGKETQRIFDYLSRINLSQDAWRELFGYARKKLDLFVVAMCNDLPSLRFVSELNPDAYEVHASCLSDEDFVKEVAKRKKPVFLGIGASTLGEVERAVSWINETGNGDIVLMYGFQSYPTQLQDMHLRFIESLKQMFSLPVGFADHTDGGSEMALITPLIASAFGANVIEKHLTYDRSARGEDFESALNPSDLQKLVLLLRDIEKAFGSSAVRPLSQAELNYRQVSKKRTVAKKQIKKNKKITKDDLVFKRSDEGAFPEESKFLIGRRARYDIAKDEPVTLEKTL